MPEIQTWRDTAHDGPQWVAEVVELPGDENELTLYSTTWHHTKAEAVRDADSWCRQMGVLLD